MRPQSAELIRQAVEAIAPEIERRIRKRRFDVSDERLLWIEMSCCILSSQVPYKTAVAAARELDKDGVLHDPLLLQRENVESRIRDLLSSPINVDGRQQRYRFPVSRAIQIAGASSAVRAESRTLSLWLARGREPDVMREWLVGHIPGMGPKQASMFLRNTAVSYDMAVIDRHVLRYMSLTGLWTSPKPVTLTKLRTYREFEALLRDSAQELGVPVGVIDWAIWVVMRMVKEKAGDDSNTRFGGT